MNGLSEIAVEESSEYCSWKLPDSPLHAGISAKAIDCILADGVRAAGLLRGHGVEVGGVLLGTCDSVTTSVTIEQAVPVAIEYAFGPTYNASERDRKELREVIRRWDRSLGQPMYVVGFYRTQPHGALSLTPEDVELFAELFPDPLSVVLLVRPRAAGSSVAGLFFREHGALRTEPSCLEFPMRPSRPEPLDVLNGPPPEPEIPDLPDPMTRVAGRRHPLWVSWWIQVPVLAGLLFVNGLMGFIAAGQLQPDPHKVKAAPKDPYALSLLVVEYGDNLHLTWDRGAPALAAAESAVLSIKDGDQNRSLDLSLEQLKNGSVTYRRVSSRVTLRLEVVMKGKRTVSESWDLASGAALPQGAIP